MHQLATACMSGSHQAGGLFRILRDWLSFPEGISILVLLLGPAVAFARAAACWDDPQLFKQRRQVAIFQALQPRCTQLEGHWSSTRVCCLCCLLRDEAVRRFYRREVQKADWQIDNSSSQGTKLHWSVLRFGRHSDAVCEGSTHSIGQARLARQRRMT